MDMPNSDGCGFCQRCPYSMKLCLRHSPPVIEESWHLYLVGSMLKRDNGECGENIGGGGS